MNSVSDSSKVMILFGALTVYINSLKDSNLKHGARYWFNKLDLQARHMWLEIQRETKSQSKECNYAFDEMEAYIIECLNTAFKVDIDRMEEFTEYIKKFNNEGSN